MNPVIQSIVNMALKSPGFQETVARLDAFISGVDARLANIEKMQAQFLAIQVDAKEKFDLYYEALTNDGSRKPE